MPGSVLIEIGQLRIHCGMKVMTVILAVIAMGFTSLAADPKDTMCVKQKDGTYKCKASGKIEKVPCCETPSNDPSPTPKPKKNGQPAPPRT